MEKKKKRGIIKEWFWGYFLSNSLKHSKINISSKAFKRKTIWLMFHTEQNAKEHILSLDLYAQAYINCMSES